MVLNASQTNTLVLRTVIAMMKERTKADVLVTWDKTIKAGAGVHSYWWEDGNKDTIASLENSLGSVSEGVCALMCCQ